MSVIFCYKSDVTLDMLNSSMAKDSFQVSYMKKFLKIYKENNGGYNSNLFCYLSVILIMKKILFEIINI